MNRLMTAIYGGRLCLAEAAGGEGGGGAGSATATGGTAAVAATATGGEAAVAATATGGTASVADGAATAGQAGGEGAATATGGEAAAANATGGEQKTSDGELTNAAGKMLAGEQKTATEGGEPKPGEVGEAKAYSDEDFTKAIVASDAVKKAAGDEEIQLSPELVKGMLPAIRKANLTPEQANELANELAAQQIAAAKAHYDARVADVKQMDAEAMKLFPDKQSWDSIGAGIKHFFKPGGTMFETISHSELGVDPEFLALMKWAGERVAKDSLGSAPGSGGEKRVSYEKALMG